MVDEAGVLELLGERIKLNIISSEILFYARISVEKHVSKKNGKRAFVHPSGRFASVTHNKFVQPAESLMVRELRDQANSYGLNECIRSDLHGMFLFHFKSYFVKDKKRPNTRSKYVNDLSNLIELPQDCLIKAKIIEDDSQICSLDGSRRLPSNENYVEIFLLKFKDPLIALPGGSPFTTTQTLNPTKRPVNLRRNKVLVK